MQKISEQQQTATADSNKHAEEIVSTMRVVRSFASESKELVRYKNRLEDVLNIGAVSLAAAVGAQRFPRNSEKGESASRFCVAVGVRREYRPCQRALLRWTFGSN